MGIMGGGGSWVKNLGWSNVQITLVDTSLDKQIRAS
jgi:hypothetical protein